MGIAIRAENLGKRYWLGGGTRSTLLKDALRDSIVGAYRRLRNDPTPISESRPREEKVLWALRDSSFEIHQGEVVGILGHNGAGKSVLLKILSRITAPTTGFAEIYGRVGSLIEIGTGFHPELSGRENIYLNGAILGMSRREVQDHFDEIVDFAGVERFIDTPVKHYSSGMTLRLAFSVAAHLQAEIVLLDEVWAAGDANFQRKSLKKMHELIGGGRTVLMVSHSMDQILQLCQRAMLFDHGRLIDDGKARDVVGRYRSLDARIEAPEAPPKVREVPTFYERRTWTDATLAPGNGRVRLREVAVQNVEGRTARRFLTGDPIDLRFALDVHDVSEPLVIAFTLVDSTNRARLIVSNLPDGTAGIGKEPGTLECPGSYLASFVLPGDALPPGSYRISIFAGTPTTLLDARDLSAENVISWSVAPRFETTELTGRSGSLHMPGRWERIRSAGEGQASGEVAPLGSHEIADPPLVGNAPAERSR